MAKSLSIGKRILTSLRRSRDFMLAHQPWRWVLAILAILAVGLFFYWWVCPPALLLPQAAQRMEETYGPQRPGGEQLGVDELRWLARQQSDVRRSIVQLATAAVLVLGLWLTFRRIKAAEDTAKAALASARTSEEGQITERFSRSVDQLGKIDAGGKPAIEVRLGGIYALERIARDSLSDAGTIAEVLAAYVRQNSPLTEGAKDGHEWHGGLRIDVQAALSAVSRIRRSVGDGLRIDLSFTSLFGADLKGANLRGADLRCSDLRHADLTSAHLGLAILEGANLGAAVLDKAFVSLTDLTNADLRGASLGETFFAPSFREDFHGISPNQLRRTITPPETKLPGGLQACESGWSFDTTEIRRFPCRSCAMGKMVVQAENRDMNMAYVSCSTCGAVGFFLVESDRLRIV